MGELEDRGEELEHRRSQRRVGESVAAQLSRAHSPPPARAHGLDTDTGVKDEVDDGTNQRRPIPRRVQACLVKS